MNKVNYQRELDQLITNIQAQGKVPRLLLHSCCAPCSSYVIEYLSNYFEITVFYYNPNIYPHKEYLYRSEEQQRLINTMATKHHVSFIEGDFDDHKFYTVCKGLENEKEGGRRCYNCFTLRLDKTAEKAQVLNYDYFSTTLTISPLKNAAAINAIGYELSEKYGVSYLAGDFKKRNGYKRSIELSHEYHLYRQSYCGCVFSKPQAEPSK
ncbi:MAG TPA: epoxyqueuosine reductase QueH [Clostridiales bacterium]|nr:epoxyqueuosine reductase QueH [Clostridiales bacterium]